MRLRQRRRRYRRHCSRLGSLSSLLLFLLLFSLTPFCSGASPVLVRTVIVSVCMLLVSALLSFFVVGCVVVGPFAVLLVLLPQL